MSVRDQMLRERLDWERRMEASERAFQWKLVGVTFIGAGIGSAIVLFATWFVRSLAP